MSDENKMNDNKTKTLLKMLRHKSHVPKNFGTFTATLRERETMHDTSKYLDDEFDGFAELDSAEVFALYSTDQAEYRRRIAKNKGIALHYQRNSHHPEHFRHGSSPESDVDLMGFLDLLEMVIDWKSACDTYGTEFADSLEKSVERFKPNGRTEHTIRLIAADLYGTPKPPIV